MTDPDPLRELARRQDDVLTRAQALRLGLHRSTVLHRLRPGGPWQRLLPGVYGTRPPATPDARVTAALLYAGPDGALTGPTALRQWRFDVPEDLRVHVSVPLAAHCASTGYVAVHRAPVPVRVVRLGRRPVRAIERAVVDAGEDPADRRAIELTLQAVLCPRGSSPGALRAALELDAVQRRLLREALAGRVPTDDPPGRRFGAAVRVSGLPEPWWNAVLCTRSGRALATVAAWWPESALAVRFDPPGAADDPAARLDRVGVTLLRVRYDQLAVTALWTATRLRVRYDAGRAEGPAAVWARHGGELVST